ncbi:MAG: TonB-dependent receptor [Flavobacteriales bacterium]|nr:TonB-dependent receptor [Flavobacteriales bacterium]
MTIKSFLSWGFLAISLGLNAQQKDTLIVYPDLQEVHINALRATPQTPMSYSNIGAQQLDEQNLGQDIPYMLSLTPSVVTTSDAGAGIGYTGFRVRGSDPTRINVTIDGIPLNDPESQGVWWVNMPDFTSSVEDIQIQRGVGTSTNGAGAFGASINLKTQSLRAKPYATTSNTIGSYSTLKNNVEFGTGLLADKFTLDGRLSRISSDGYIDRATSDLKSLYLSGAYYGTDEVLKLSVISGKEKTYQAWNGVPLSYLDNDSLRTYNSYTYDNETDNYWQDHYMLHYNKQLANSGTFNLGLHFTHGEGYYEQYKNGQDFADYGLNNVIVGKDTLTETDLIRRKWLDNDFYGAVFSYNNRKDKLDYTIGGGWNTYEGRHYGVVRWAEYASNSQIDHIYYDNDGIKTDFNLYAKGHYQYSDDVTVYADLQHRQIDYSFLGKDENGAERNDTVNFEFFNPKFGAYYQIDNKSSAFASFAIANREPNRSDFVESSPNSRPLHETLYDTEVGYKMEGSNFAFSATAYYMIYENQLILTGKINDVGEYTRENVDYSERKGIELEAGIKINPKWSWSANATFSENTIAHYTEYVDNWDTWGQESKSYSNTTIAFSPDMIWASQLDYQFKDNIEVQFISKYVDEQFIDNTSSDDRKLDAYLVHHARLIWDIESELFKSARLSLQVNNLLDEKYVNNAWVYRFKSDGYDPRPDDPYVTANSEGGYDMAGYFPQAKRNFLIGLSLGF